jgi:hypothetical protein
MAPTATLSVALPEIISQKPKKRGRAGGRRAPSPAIPGFDVHEAIPKRKSARCACADCIDELSDARIEVGAFHCTKTCNLRCNEIVIKCDPNRSSSSAPSADAARAPLSIVAFGASPIT